MFICLFVLYTFDCLSLRVVRLLCGCVYTWCLGFWFIGCFVWVVVVVAWICWFCCCVVCFISTCSCLGLGCGLCDEVVVMVCFGCCVCVFLS